MPIAFEDKSLDKDDVAVVNIYLTKGDDANAQLDFTDDGVAVNFTNYTAKMTVRETTDGDEIVGLTSANSSIVLGGMAGTCVIAFTDTTSSAIDPGDYVYDLQLTDGSGLKRTYMRGKFCVYREVTT